MEEVTGNLEISNLFQEDFQLDLYCLKIWTWEALCVHSPVNSAKRNSRPHLPPTVTRPPGSTLCQSQLGVH